jgi:hypothetical protein
MPRKVAPRVKGKSTSSATAKGPTKLSKSPSPTPAPTTAKTSAADVWLEAVQSQSQFSELPQLEDAFHPLETQEPAEPGIVEEAEEQVVTEEEYQPASEENLLAAEMPTGIESRQPSSTSLMIMEHNDPTAGTSSDTGSSEWQFGVPAHGDAFADSSLSQAAFGLHASGVSAPLQSAVQENFPYVQPYAEAGTVIHMDDTSIDASTTGDAISGDLGYVGMCLVLLPKPLIYNYSVYNFK